MPSHIRLRLNFDQLRMFWPLAFQPDLILVDWNMPEMTGIELLQAVKSEGLKVKLGFVTFLSGPAAESFGVPAGNAAKTIVEAFNKAQAPAPYNKTGFGGLRIEMVMVDEAGGAAKQVQELRNLYQRENVDAIVGYIGSGDCLAVAPVAEELKKLLVLFDCGTPRIFEDGNYTTVFRTASHATMDNVSLTRYLKSRNVKVDTFNLINQDYAWGQDSRADFIAAMAHLYPAAKPGADLLPKFGAGQYGTEISSLLSSPASSASAAPRSTPTPGTTPST